MSGIVVAVIAIATFPFFSLTKAAGAADQRLEELRNAFIQREECKDGGKKEN